MHAQSRFARLRSAYRIQLILKLLSARLIDSQMAVAPRYSDLERLVSLH